ncbi:hypothetical protein GGS21DRAFT_521419 [Xylaria nigripes]|nr:hypothetical protein GGS21DRAFT_521419 [Xylaria nigripes]
MLYSKVSDAINSMYRWYKDGTLYFAYLTDVESRGCSAGGDGASIKVVLKSRIDNAEIDCSDN